ncbi:Hypothetical_protein [Hexamita inflata]|uniref:Hypothetical_protein n=1 Tax=Hexamita inflata TaxID=28002 RepID=A0AA86QK17_9EUKA|nr:Hypothetical protein HINF_LOCUS45492 [Hexamita inflata]
MLSTYCYFLSLVEVESLQHSFLSYAVPDYYLHSTMRITKQLRTNLPPIMLNKAKPVPKLVLKTNFEEPNTSQFSIQSAQSIDNEIESLTDSFSFTNLHELKECNKDFKIDFRDKMFD